MRLLRGRNSLHFISVLPGNPSITIQPSGPLQEGTIAEVECESRGGSPPPQIYWEFSNGTKLEGGRIQNATDLVLPILLLHTQNDYIW